MTKSAADREPPMCPDWAVYTMSTTLMRMASEDIGMADPRALEQAAAAAWAVEHVGMPECELALAQCAVYLCLAPKSNALYRNNFV